MRWPDEETDRRLSAWIKRGATREDQELVRQVLSDISHGQQHVWFGEADLALGPGWYVIEPRPGLLVQVNLYSDPEHFTVHFIGERAEA